MFSNRVTYANVMSTVAVFVALGGASYAATQLPPNSIGSRQLRDGAVTPPKLAIPVGGGLSRGGSGSQPTSLRLAGTCPPKASCPAPAPTTLTSATVTLTRPAKVLVLASAVADDTVGTCCDTGSAEVTLALASQPTQAQSPPSVSSSLQRGGPTLISAPFVTSLPAGRSVIALVASTSVSQAQAAPGTGISASNAQLIVLALP